MRKFQLEQPAGEACTGAVFDLYADAKRHAVCKIDGLRTYAACLKDVIDCDAVDACNAAKQSADGRCPTFNEGGATQALPPACTNVM